MTETTEHKCPRCESEKTVSGSCFGVSPDSFAYRFVPDNDASWLEAIKHVAGTGGVAFGNRKFHLCSACGHLWLNILGQLS